jgi:hypothetical protein
VRATYLLIPLFFLSSFLIHAEEIQLKDGSKISGKLTSIEGSVFHVKTAYGEIQVPRSEVVLIRFPENSPKEEGTGPTSAVVPPVDESLDGTTYSNRTAHFQADVPAGWTIAPELRKTKDISAALESGDQALFFMVTVEQYSGSLSTYRVLAETTIQSKIQEYKKESEAEAKLDGRTGVRMVISGKTATTPLKFLVYILPYEGRMVRLTFFTLEPLFSDAVPIFEKIGASYHSTSDKPVAQGRTNALRDIPN